MNYHAVNLCLLDSVHVCVCVCVCVSVCVCVCVCVCIMHVFILGCVEGDEIMFGYKYVFPDFSFSQDHQRVGRTGETCQNSSICAYAC